MKKIAALLFCLVLVVCGKKTQTRIASEEEVEIKTTLPEASWSQNLVLSSEDTSAINAYIEDALAERLAANPAWKVTMETSVRDTVPVYLIETAAVLSEGRLRLRLSVRDKDAVIMETEQDTSSEAVLLAVEAVSRAVFRHFSGEEGRPKAKPVSLEALMCIADGKKLLKKENHQSTNEAVQNFKEALRLDSTLTDAWLGLSESYLQIMERGWDRRMVWLGLAQTSVRKALEIDSTLGEGRAYLGKIYFRMGDLRSSEAAYRKALQHNSSLGDAWKGLGIIFSAYGLYNPALQSYENALKLNPEDYAVSQSRALILTGKGQYEASDLQLKEILQTYPDSTGVRVLLALNALYQNRLDEADQWIAPAIESGKPLTRAVLAMIYAKKGQGDEALGELELEVKPKTGNNPGLGIAVAAIYALLKQNGQAMAWLEKSLDWGYSEYPWLMQDPNMDGLRSDPRFESLAAGLREKWLARIESYRPPDGN